MTEIVKVCKKHGGLIIEQVVLNRFSPSNKPYYRCRICRNNSEKNRINKTKYITTRKKHIKNKLPNFINKEDKNHAYTILYKFKMNAKEYYELLEKQNYVCAICKKPETQIKRKSNKIKMLSVDHCHETGKIRGLLCFKCNIGIGSFNDSIELFLYAIKYIKTNSQ